MRLLDSLRKSLETPKPDETESIYDHRGIQFLDTPSHRKVTEHDLTRPLDDEPHARWFDLNALLTQMRERPFK